MRSYSLQARCCLVIAFFIAGSISTSPAQGLKSTIPKDQKPLLKIFPPQTAEQTPAGTGKFVIFTREEIGKQNDWDFIAGAWECIPSRPDVPVTKRVEFCHSSWNAEPLLNTLVRDDSKGLFPRFVRLQVGARDRNYKVNLYDINYRTWDVRCLWQGDRLSAFGVIKNSVFCHDSRDWFRLDATLGRISKELPFIPLGVDRASWLVQKTGEKPGIWSYDPARERFVGHFGTVDEPQMGDTRSLLSADGRNRAWILVPPMPNDWRGGVVGGTFLLQRDGQSDDIRVPVVMQARAGSGRPVTPIGIRLMFTEDGRVEFRASQGKSEKNDRVWTIEIASGNTAESVRPYVAPDKDDPALFDGVPTPDYLRPHLIGLRHFGRGGLAPAFLAHLGILKKQPEFPDCTTGVSRDGRHILYNARKGPLADVFIYGDLHTKQTLRWANPAGIKQGDSMDFVWVETP